MAQYFCHSCALAQQIITPLDASTMNFTGSAYQLEKFIKHTAPIDYNGVVSIFDTPEYSSYRDYAVSASLSGCAQIDDRGRTNLIWYADKHVGITYENGNYLLPADGVKVAFHDNQFTFHQFPTNIEAHYIKRCPICDRVIFA